MDHTLTVEIVLNDRSGRELRKREQALRRALKRCPGRDTLTLIEGLVVMLEVEHDEEGARRLGQALEALKDLRYAARGGPREQPGPGPTAGAPY